MKTLTLGKTRFALATFATKSRSIGLAVILLSAALAFLAPIARAQSEQKETKLTTESREAIVDGAPGPAFPDEAREPVVKSIVEKHPRPVRPDFNRNIYFRNKLEFSFDVGWLPVNIPFPFDVLEGDPYDLYPLRYTLVPVMASVRWHLGNPWGPPVLRGNWDVTFSLSATAIPRGPETHYLSYNMGLRRNFIPRNWRVTPYWDVRAGVGYINAKGPLGVYYAQGQNFTFNINMGAGARYNLNPHYAVSAGLNWMHISNGNLSSPAYSNYGINVYGPMLGLDIQLRPHSRQSQ